MVKSGIDNKNFKELRRLLISKLIIFNGRRPNEAASLTCKMVNLAIASHSVIKEKSSYIIFVPAKDSKNRAHTHTNSLKRCIVAIDSQ